ncbi:hypothetical protein L6164_034174 [Bauhinia variegata]|uniref:Uncharacterized protein n=1 Tax=Bauhinia variegata TaxID=167791 RepID=A0ACB9KTX1_BAUVA|nr:hypothetical protein L6164_034174 [Bauhinia variegata]
MALVSGGRSTLNPNAPLFVPAAFRMVEDFSAEWWQLITTLTWYRDYWVSQHDGFYDNAEDEFDSNNAVDFLPDTFDLDVGEEDFSGLEDQFEEFIQSSETEGETGPNSWVESEHGAKPPSQASTFVSILLIPSLSWFAKISHDLPIDVLSLSDDEAIGLDSSG